MQFRKCLKIENVQERKKLIIFYSVKFTLELHFWGSKINHQSCAFFEHRRCREALRLHLYEKVYLSKYMRCALYEIAYSIDTDVVFKECKNQSIYIIKIKMVVKIYLGQF